MEISRKDVKKAIIRIVGAALVSKGYQLSKEKTDKRILLKYYTDGLVENKWMRTEVEFQISSPLQVTVNLNAGEFPPGERDTKDLAFSDTVRRISPIRLTMLYEDRGNLELGQWWNFVKKGDLESHCIDMLDKINKYRLPFLKAPFILSEEFWRGMKVMPREVKWDAAIPSRVYIDILLRTIEPDLQNNGYQRMKEEVGGWVLPKYYQEALI